MYLEKAKMEILIGLMPAAITATTIAVGVVGIAGAFAAVKWIVGRWE